MFEPLLGPLTRGHVAGEASRRADFRVAIDSPGGRQGSNATMFEPLRCVAAVEQSWRRPEAGTAVEIAGFGQI